MLECLKNYTDREPGFKTMAGDHTLSAFRGQARNSGIPKYALLASIFIQSYLIQIHALTSYVWPP